LRRARLRGARKPQDAIWHRTKRGRDGDGKYNTCNIHKANGQGPMKLHGRSMRELRE